MGEARQTREERKQERLQDAVDKPWDELAAEPATRLIPLTDIESAQLRRRIWQCYLTLRLSDGTVVRYKWLNSTKYATSYHDADTALRKVLGGRLAT